MPSTLSNRRTLTVGSLFTGIGGIDLAAEWAEMEILWQCEIDEFCQKVLKKHWPEVELYDDITTLNKKHKLRAVDVVVGGFPCQPYSIAGKQRGKEDDRDLWPEMFRVIKEIRPTWVVGENVAHFAHMELDRTLSDLESIGYKGKSFIIPACAVNAPHKRDRVFVVAHLSDTCSIGHKRVERLQKNNQQVATRRKSPFRSTTKLFDDIDWKKRAAESGFLGRNDGIPNRVDRIRGLGNAVVPQQIYPILKYIKLIHEQMAKEVIS